MENYNMEEFVTPEHIIIFGSFILGIITIWIRLSKNNREVRDGLISTITENRRKLDSSGPRLSAVEQHDEKMTEAVGQLEKDVARLDVKYEAIYQTVGRIDIKVDDIAKNVMNILINNSKKS